MNYIVQEIKKEFKKNYYSKFAILSTIIQPFISFAVIYFSYKMFQIEVNDRTFLVTIILNYTAYNFFASIVISAWSMTREREEGTLEVILLSPTSLRKFIFSRALFNSIICSINYFIITILIILIIPISFQLIVQLMVIYLATFLSSIFYAYLINSLFLFTRDSTLLFNILQSPVEYLSKVRFPQMEFPIILNYLSLIIPMTYIVKMIQGSFNINYLISVVILISISVVIMFISNYVIKSASKNLKKSGKYTFY